MTSVHAYYYKGWRNYTTEDISTIIKFYEQSSSSRNLNHELVIQTKNAICRYYLKTLCHNTTATLDRLLLSH